MTPDEAKIVAARAVARVEALGDAVEVLRVMGQSSSVPVADALGEAAQQIVKMMLAENDRLDRIVSDFKHSVAGVIMIEPSP